MLLIFFITGGLLGQNRERETAAKGTVFEEETLNDTKEAARYVSASISAGGEGNAEDGAGDGEMKETAAEKKPIALTFDDGPSGPWTPALLDGLKKRDVKATFFLIGKNAKKYPELVKRMYAEGHLIGNHTYSHVQLDKVSWNEAKKEVEKTDAIIYEITGAHTGFTRPPYGLWRKELEEKLNVLPVMWNIDPLDWETENTEEIVRKVVTEAEEGAIILLHDCYEASVKAALQIVDTLQDDGYRFVTVDELLMN